MDGGRTGLTVHDDFAGYSRAFPGAAGRGIRVAVIDSGVHASHPHMQGVAGGITFGETVSANEYVDTMGHGTAVMAAIQEKAPGALYFAVRVFLSELRASIDVIVRAIEWCLDHRMDVINLSLGTSNPRHAERLAALVARAAQAGVVLVSADDVNGMPAFPGRLPGAFGVNVDWDCPRDSYSYEQGPGDLLWLASGYPRPIPGVPEERNLRGISFAVANMTGFVVRGCEGMAQRSHGRVQAVLLAEADRIAAHRPFSQ